MTRNLSNSITNLNHFITWGRTVGTGARAIAANFKTASLATLTTTIAALPLLTVGCSSDKPKPISSLGTAPLTQTVVSQPVAAASSTVATAAHKPVRKPRPANVTYTDKLSGVSFQFPRRFGLKTGEDADALVSSIPLPMNFVQPGGVALAAVELPASAYSGNNLAAAFFDVSVNKSLTAEQCTQFAASSTDTATKTENAPTAIPVKMVVGDLDLLSTEMLSSQSNMLSDGKYFHTYQNGACYEFAMHVATGGEEAVANMKPINRDQIFSRLEKVLATVRVASIPTEQVAKEAAPTPTTTTTPAQ
jgi:hypothetical protein